MDLVTLENILKDREEMIMSSDIFKFPDACSYLYSSLKYTKFTYETSYSEIMDYYGPRFYKKNVPAFYNDLIDRINDPEFYSCYPDGDDYKILFNYEKAYNYRTDEASIRRAFSKAKDYVPEFRDNIDLALAKIEVNKMLYKDQVIKKYLISEEERKAKEKSLKEGLEPTVKL